MVRACLELGWVEIARNDICSYQTLRDGPPRDATENVGEHTSALAYVPSTPNSGTGGFGSIEAAAA